MKPLKVLQAFRFLKLIQDLKLKIILSSVHSCECLLRLRKLHSKPAGLRSLHDSLVQTSSPTFVIMISAAHSGVRRRGVWGFSPQKIFGFSGLKTHGFLSFEAPYPMYFSMVDATLSDRTTLIFFHVCSECIPTGTNSSRKEAGN